MKFKLFFLATVLFLAACSKSSGPAPSVSTFNITYNGKTYAESTDSPSSIYGGSLFANIDTGALGIPNGSGCFIGFLSSGIKVYFVGESYAEIATGNYKVLGGGYVNNYNDSNKIFQTVDTTGVITVSADDSRHMAGTFTCKLQNNGVICSASGSFDILK